MRRDVLEPSTLLFAGLSLVELAFATSCGVTDDLVFEPVLLQVRSDELRVREGSGWVTLAVELERPVRNDVFASYQVVGIDARQDCQAADFRAEDGQLSWLRGSGEANFEIWIGDDEQAEVDERLELRIENVEGGRMEPSGPISIRIEDDDRTLLLDAEQDFGVTPGLPDDQSEALQTVLDAAAEGGRAVVRMSPGNYFVSSVRLAPGTSLIAREVSWMRPSLVGETVVTLRLAHEGVADSAVTLVEGLHIDGQRDQQGPFQEMELENAHLLGLVGGAASAGRLRASIQDVRLTEGTGDGLAIGPNVDATVCAVTAHNIWRDTVGLHGGNTTLRARAVQSNAELGTSGMWLDGYIPGFEGSQVVDVELEQIHLATGDLEIEVVQGSTLSIRELQMDRPPFRLFAPQATVRIADSTLFLGVPSERHNHWEAPADVRVVRSTIVTEESIDEAAVTEELDRSWSIIDVRWPEAMSGEETHPGLSFDRCQFSRGASVEPTDQVTVLGTQGDGATISVRDSSLSDCACNWLAAQCSGCSVDD